MSADTSTATRSGRLIRADRSIPVDAPGSAGVESCAIRLILDTDAFDGRTAAYGRAAVVFCFPGGGYAKEYFDPAPPLGEDYSMAVYLARRGFAVVLCDHLGVGGSSHPANPEQLGPRELADADAQTVARVAALIAAGGLLPGVLAPCPDAILLGLAHSMGGGLLVLQQARHPRFQAIATMGWSALHMPSSAELAQLEEAVASAPGRLEPSADHPGYLRVQRGPLQHAAYHWPDVPAWVIAADDAAATELPSAVASAMNVPGAVAAEAALIEVPVLVLMGEHDLRMPGSDELSAYPASSHAAYIELPRSGHCHNLASTRLLAWEQMAAWLESVA